MRKITEQARDALISGRTFMSGNTYVSNGQLRLHGNLIAEVVNGCLVITNAGWFSNTTKDRLNALPGVHIVQRKGVWFLNGSEWSGQPTVIGSIS